MAQDPYAALTATHQLAAHGGALSSSFHELLQQVDPQAAPRLLQADSGDIAPHGTTIVALTYPGGVLLAGDRRATMGNLIAHRAMRKVFPTDDYSCVGIAGTAGIAIEMIRLYRVELEHYEKIEGTLMSFEGKANRLAHMVRNNLPMAMQGLSVVPLFAGFDLAEGVGKIFSFDVTGGRYEEHGHHAVGSGSLFARGALKKLYQPSADRTEAIRVAIESLYDAADDDSATGGPDPTRQIWPIVATVEESGYREVPEAQVGQVAQEIAAERTARYGGPAAPSGGNNA